MASGHWSQSPKSPGAPRAITTWRNSLLRSLLTDRKAVQRVRLGQPRDVANGTVEILTGIPTASRQRDRSVASRDDAQRMSAYSWPSSSGVQRPPSRYQRARSMPRDSTGGCRDPGVGCLNSPASPRAQSARGSRPRSRAGGCGFRRDGRVPGRELVVHDPDTDMVPCLVAEKSWTTLRSASTGSLGGGEGLAEEAEGVLVASREIRVEQFFLRTCDARREQPAST